VVARFGDQLHDGRLYSHPVGGGHRHGARQPHFRSQERLIGQKQAWSLCFGAIFSDFAIAVRFHNLPGQSGRFDDTHIENTTVTS
jgi:hypothetical protein